ncbi:MAG: hypothetical protein JO053_03820 [Acidobacteria bacterium]|nr:hypothetical protein [Acidobacteriota bacterium]
MYEITKSDITRGRRLLAGALAAPAAFTAIPAVITLLLLFLAPLSPPSAFVVLFLGIVVTAIGLILGLITAGVLVARRSKWSRELREKIAADGIRPDELGWFMSELKASEKRALRSIESRDMLMGDAYRETLASRLTATRIVRSSRKELQLAKRRQNSLKQLKAASTDEFREEVARDIDKISGIHDEAKAMLAESEARLQMIEAAASRGGSIADNELALKKLTARTNALPLALESAKMTDEIRAELESEDDPPK